jgi:uncharacterized protein YukE
MPRNELTVVNGGGKKQFLDVADIIKSSAARAKLQSYIDETVRLKTKIKDDNESIREIKESAASELGVKPQVFSALVNTFFNNNFEQKQEEMEELINAIEALMQVSALPSSPFKDEE